MTAADIQAIAASVTAVAAAGGVLTWVWRSSQKVRSWRRRRQRDAILNLVIPACVATLVIALILANRSGDA